MPLPTTIVVLYSAIFVLALTLAFWQRSSFPLGETLAVTLIIGLGFTGLVYLVTPQAPLITTGSAQPGELRFMLVYLAGLSYILTRPRPLPGAWKGHFLKEELAKLVFKLVLFVLLPLLVLVFAWGRDWAVLGFNLGNLPGQLVAALVLMLAFGGFNLFAGSAAKPLRERQFSARQVGLGFSVAFLWHILEVGLVEEFFFRAFVQAQLVDLLGSPLAGICAASLLFGLAHAPGIYLRGADKVGPLGEKPTLLHTLLYAVLVLSTTGWFTGLLYWRTQSLLAPVLVHAAVDAVAATADFIQGLKIKR